MTKIFDIDGEALVLNEQVLAIPELAAIKETFPDHYITVYKYIYFYTTPDFQKNPYYSIPEAERKEVLTKDFLMDDNIDPDNPVIISAVEKCDWFYDQDPIVKFQKAHTKAVLHIADYISNSEGVSKWNKDVIATAEKFLKQAGNYIDQFRKTTNIAAAEMGKAEGGTDIPYDFE